MDLTPVQFFLTFLVTVNSLGFHGFHFKGLEEPKWIGTRNIGEKWIEQPIDHFNHRDNRTWKMRYFEEDKYFNNSGPIFVMLGGEWTISPGYLQTGLMHSLAEQHGALMFYTEHRYYGKSRPTKDMSSSHLQYLSVDQALADVAYLMKQVKNERNIEKSKVIVFGGSYAGNMAAWIRIKYPHLIQGAVASSAPVRAKADFPEYYQVVTKSLKKYNEACSETINTALEQIKQLLLSEGGQEEIKKAFNFCSTVNATSEKDTSFFMNYLAEVFAGTVQYNKVNHTSNTSGISKVCDRMMNATDGKEYQRLARLTQKGSSCKNITYWDFVNEMRNTTWDTNSASRVWYHQTCVEFGYYQTSYSKDSSAFGNSFNLDFFVDMCSDIFGEYHDKDLVDYGVNRTNIEYGGKFPDVTNVIFVNGDIDPWHALSVLEDLNESSPAIFISGSSHCQDLKEDEVSDIPALTDARKQIRNIISKWLSST
ncbi:hypothetical protein QAD02_017886 [Eretmocerus hayati]|uniref:Uncharacterized protein n=1 Tax=Eretmocerus hayati TaxID=131215 RepID=A0ACC2PFL4_9HYME|nr:hypothetical protein QAD02_017886 [Eretmocerus hayati]